MSAPLDVDPDAPDFVYDELGLLHENCEEHGLPAEAELREWLEFIELQCEECFPSEWPL